MANSYYITASCIVVYFCTIPRFTEGGLYLRPFNQQGPQLTAFELSELAKIKQRELTARSHVHHHSPPQHLPTHHLPTHQLPTHQRPHVPSLHFVPVLRDADEDNNDEASMEPSLQFVEASLSPDQQSVSPMELRESTLTSLLLEQNPTLLRTSDNLQWLRDASTSSSGNSPATRIVNKPFEPNKSLFTTELKPPVLPSRLFKPASPNFVFSDEKHPIFFISEPTSPAFSSNFQTIPVLTIDHADTPATSEAQPILVHTNSQYDKIPIYEIFSPQPHFYTLATPQYTTQRSTPDPRTHISKQNFFSSQNFNTAPSGIINPAFGQSFGQSSFGSGFGGGFGGFQSRPFGIPISTGSSFSQSSSSASTGPTFFRSSTIPDTLDGRLENSDIDPLLTAYIINVPLRKHSKRNLVKRYVSQNISSNYLIPIFQGIQTAFQNDSSGVILGPLEAIEDILTKYPITQNLALRETPTGPQLVSTFSANFPELGGGTSKLRSKRSSGLIKILTSPNNKLDIPKSENNLRNVAQHTFQSESLPIVHIRNALGSARKALHNSVNIPLFELFTKRRTDKSTPIVSSTLKSPDQIVKISETPMWVRFAEASRKTVDQTQDSLIHLTSMFDSSRRAIGTLRNTPKILLPVLTIPKTTRVDPKVLAVPQDQLLSRSEEIPQDSFIRLKPKQKIMAIRRNNGDPIVGLIEGDTERQIILRPIGKFRSRSRKMYFVADPKDQVSLLIMPKNVASSENMENVDDNSEGVSEFIARQTGEPNESNLESSVSDEELVNSRNIENSPNTQKIIPLIFPTDANTFKILTRPPVEEEQLPKFVHLIPPSLFPIENEHFIIHRRPLTINPEMNPNFVQEIQANAFPIPRNSPPQPPNIFPVRTLDKVPIFNRPPSQQLDKFVPRHPPPKFPVSPSFHIVQRPVQIPPERNPNFQEQDPRQFDQRISENSFNNAVNIIPRNDLSSFEMSNGMNQQNQLQMTNLNEDKSRSHVHVNKVVNIGDPSQFMNSPMITDFLSDMRQRLGHIVSSIRRPVQHGACTDPAHINQQINHNVQNNQHIQGVRMNENMEQDRSQSPQIGPVLNKPLVSLAAQQEINNNMKQDLLQSPQLRPPLNKPFLGLATQQQLNDFLPPQDQLNTESNNENNNFNLNRNSDIMELKSVKNN